ncbi:unnamed protein product [Linum tenue]|uniref:DUF4283 domain-containing protein n=2 Tax=Linum tenue TaxID=586396 RepID=A0AAV0Q234_9ROSI|nr:unnamed protein product [Linum tenue]
MGGPWLLGDTYLTVHRWFKGFNPWKSVITSTMIWAQLPELPIEFINKEAVMRIAEQIGKPVRVDRVTELGARGKYARVCVEVDLTLPLLSQYKIEGVTYLIQYEGLDHICTNCGKYGKSAEKCDCNSMDPSMDADATPQDEVQVEDPTKGQTYGEWMMVRKRDRRSGRRGESGEPTGNGQNKHNRSKFYKTTLKRRGREGFPPKVSRISPRHMYPHVTDSVRDPHHAEGHEILKQPTNH